MHCIDWTSRIGGLCVVALLGACAGNPFKPSPPPPPPPAPVVVPAPVPVRPPAPPVAPPPPPPAPVPAPRVEAPARSWDEYKLRAAFKIVQANPGATYTGPIPDPLRSIPVLQIHLNRDGTVRSIDTLRVPRQSPETLQMAVQAIRKVASFGPVDHLPHPWQFSETFLYNDELKFQIRTLAEVP